MIWTTFSKADLKAEVSVCHNGETGLAVSDSEQPAQQQTLNTTPTPPAGTTENAVRRILGKDQREVR